MREETFGVTAKRTDITLYEKSEGGARGTKLK